METNYEQSYRRIMDYQKEIHAKNQKKIRWGIRCVVLIPLVFLMLMFSMDSSKVVFLVLWIVSLFTISAYLIYVEYMDYTLQLQLTELGIKEDGKIDELLPDRTLIARYFEDELRSDELLLEDGSAGCEAENVDRNLTNDAERKTKDKQKKSTLKSVEETTDNDDKKKQKHKINKHEVSDFEKANKKSESEHKKEKKASDHKKKQKKSKEDES